MNDRRIGLSQWELHKYRQCDPDDCFYCEEEWEKWGDDYDKEWDNDDWDDE